uniref:Uncharacterized protein n=1 Tax=Arundo donax TaxID=35708 RepID=A0A0A9D6F6_ARUDO
MIYDVTMIIEAKDNYPSRKNISKLQIKVHGCKHILSWIALTTSKPISYILWDKCKDVSAIKGSNAVLYYMEVFISKILSP